MSKRSNQDNPGRIGAVKFWAWSARDLSVSANFIVLSFLSIYCTNPLHMNPLLVGTLLLVSRVVDAVTDLVAGYIVDRTGYEEFLKYVMEGVQLPEKAEVASRIYWGGKHYDRANELH